MFKTISIIYQKYYLDPSVLLEFKCTISKSLFLGHKKHDKEDDDEEEEDDNEEEKHHSKKKGLLIFLNHSWILSSMLEYPVISTT